MKAWIAIGLLTFVTFFKNGDCTISAWSSPVIATADGGSGTLTSTIDDGATTTTTLTITVTATTDGTVSGYALTQDPATGATFAISNAGLLSISAGTVSYSTAPVYTFVVTATDGSGSTSATVTLSVNDVPAFGATQYGYTIADASAAGTTLTTLAATDVVNSGSLTYTFSSGNTNTDFAVSSAGVITTANAMAASTLGGYSLVLEGADATLTGTTTVWVVVTSCSGAATILASVMTLLMAMTAALY